MRARFVLLVLLAGFACWPLASDAADPADAHSNDKTTRLLVLAPGGPVIIGLTMTIDGEPFRAPRERYLDELMKQADTDGEGRPTWSQALRNPQFTSGRFGTRRLERPAVEVLARQFDRNGDGLVDREELRKFIMADSGEDLAIGRIALSAIPDLRPLLDADGDGVLSSEEIQAAAVSAFGPVWFTRMDRNDDGDLSRDEFLGSRAQFDEIDADGNGLIDATEAARYRTRARFPSAK
jgi:Ca2+-binding EF-hand superfamily protein